MKRGSHIMSEETQENLPIDYPSALARIGNDESFLKELLELYLMDFEGKQEELNAAIEGMDFIAIQEIGHSLKGSSANLSLPDLQKASYGIEMSGRNRDIAEAQRAYEDLLRAFQGLKTHLATKN
jgi:HPt (histidine-containing phosphotransfer) domain-containing protein